MVDGGRVGAAGRAAVVGDFAAALRALRASVGNPSFREMSGRSRAISHTTLHEAAQGHRLPSWSTTVEFVKACHGDPADYRQRWCDASAAVRLATVPAADTDEPAEPAEAVADASPHRRPVLLGVAAVIAVVAAVLAVVLAGYGDTPRRSAAGPSGQHGAVGEAAATARLRAVDCPVQQTNPPPAPPAHPGDRGRFIGDITVPDCSHVPHATTFTKIWRFKDTGTVAWRGYSLRRLDLPDRRNTCQTITDVPIPTTAPGEFVDVHVEVTAPSSAGFCFVRFRFVDASGRDAFPSGRPINFQVIVD